jgi:hypothetical protein
MASELLIFVGLDQKGSPVIKTKEKGWNGERFHTLLLLFPMLGNPEEKIPLERHSDR